MRNKKDRKDLIFRLTSVTLFIIGFFVVSFSNIKTYTNITYNNNNNHSLQTMYLISKKVMNNVNIKNVTTMDEILTYVNSNVVSYNNTVGSYGTTKNNEITTCLSNFNKNDGNVFYYDKQYGYARIIEADSRIPCGTIIKISNLKNFSEFYAIVLDHSDLNLETKTNLLFESQEAASGFIQSNALSTIVRWGW